MHAWTCTGTHQNRAPRTIMQHPNKILTTTQNCCLDAEIRIKKWRNCENFWLRRQNSKQVLLKLRKVCKKDKLFEGPYYFFWFCYQLTKRPLYTQVYLTRACHKFIHCPCVKDLCLRMNLCALFFFSDALCLILIQQKLCSY